MRTDKHRSRSERRRAMLRRMPLGFKVVFLVSGALCFFILFPFAVRLGGGVTTLFAALLLVLGWLFRSVAGRRVFRITLGLWLAGSTVYLAVAAVLIYRNIQPLPYLTLTRSQLVIYYLSYSLRVLGVFFTGLIFVHITSPLEFMRRGRLGLWLAVALRSFEYAVTIFEQNRIALVIQGEWPESGGRWLGLRDMGRLVRSVPVLVAMSFRNLILWCPWAWICHRHLKRQIQQEEKSCACF